MADHWGEPDGGVWESTGPPARLVASRVQAWFALDRMARLGRNANPLDLQAAAWHQEARRILAWLEADALAPATAGAPAVCAAMAPRTPATILMPPCCGSPGGARGPASTPSWPPPLDRVLEQLGSGALVYRYPPAGR